MRYLKAVLTARRAEASIVDVSTGDMPHEADVTAAEVAAYHPDGAGAVFCGDRGRAIAAMSLALTRFLTDRDDLGGALAIGGSGGTALVAPALQALPIGVPKLMVSTVASGNTAPYVGESDIGMVYSVVDMQGLNRISRVVLANAADAMAGMVLNAPPACDDGLTSVGITMFGVTTPCVARITEALRDRFECLVFHATGAGGRSMERLIDQGVIRGVLDVTTTEFCDYVAGGIFPCGEERLDAVSRTGVPYVGSCGGLDMVNFGARATVPEQYRDRVFVEHNPFITLMRTSAEECAAMGRVIGGKLNQCQGEVRFFYPESGFSLLDQSGGPFSDPKADAAFLEALSATLEETERRRLIRLPYALNDPAFADAMTREFETLFKERTDYAGYSTQ
nr:Tm-1-like ATP-binding domain-containing protein [Acetobacter fallax]